MFFFHYFNFIFLDFLGIFSSNELENLKSSQRVNSGENKSKRQYLIKRKRFTIMWLISCGRNNDYVHFKDCILFHFCIFVFIFFSASYSQKNAQQKTTSILTQNSFDLKFVLTKSKCKLEYAFMKFNKMWLLPVSKILAHKDSFYLPLFSFFLLWTLSISQKSQMINT